MLQPWFQEAKLGIFIHWGIYAVKGISESWSFFRGQISYEDYMAQCAGFTAERYDPAHWADLFRRAGARYAVLTTKHHDGVALWDTQLSDLSVVKKTPAGRDLIGPFCRALRDAGLKTGLYFSHLDWSHPDYPSVFTAGHRAASPEAQKALNRYAYPLPGQEDPARWERFLQFHHGQLKELCTQYHPDLLWFDGDWERDDDQWRMKELRDLLHQWAPGVILNSRMRGHGDYQTPEQGLPIHAPQGPWEFCMTINNSWGYQGKDPRLQVRPADHPHLRRVHRHGRQSAAGHRTDGRWNDPPRASRAAGGVGRLDCQTCRSGLPHDGRPAAGAFLRRHHAEQVARCAVRDALRPAVGTAWPSRASATRSSECRW